MKTSGLWRPEFCSQALRSQQRSSPGGDKAAFELQRDLSSHTEDDCSAQVTEARRQEL